MCNSIGGCYALRHRTSPLPTDLLSLTASHDTDYYITIVVTNLAYLQTQLTQQITIDTTPPLQGVVFDGNSSSDIDYQQEPLVTAWWSGFFDRESDIQFYQYIFGTACADQSIFTIPALHNVSISYCCSPLYCCNHHFNRLVQLMTLELLGQLQRMDCIMLPWQLSTQLYVTLLLCVLMA